MSFRKIGWMVLFVSGLGWLIADGVRQLTFEATVREMLLKVQAALQDYHVAQERYIPRSELSGHDLISVLSDFEYLAPLPINPWSGLVWRLDGQEPDFLIYRTDANFETYSLQAMDSKNDQIIMELDSEQNPSLE